MKVRADWKLITPHQHIITYSAANSLGMRILTVSFFLVIFFLTARVIMDRDNGRSRGFGFVTFASNEDAARAMQALDGQVLIFLVVTLLLFWGEKERPGCG